MCVLASLSSVGSGHQRVSIATPEFRDLVIARLPIYKYQAGRLAFVCVCVCVLAFDALMALYQKMRQLVKLSH